MMQEVGQDPELVGVAEEVLSSGGTVDDAAAALMSATHRPIAAIKALRLAKPGLDLADAKHAIDRNLSPEALQAREDLLDRLEQAIRDESEA